MKRLFTLLLAISTSLVLNAQSTIVTEWNFNDQTTNPSTGSGQVSLLGGVTEWQGSSDIPAGYSSGCNPVTLLLEDGTMTGNWAYNLTNFPEQGSNSGTAGVQFKTSTVGHQNVSFIFNLRRSGTASTYFQVLSSTNGTDWEIVATERNLTTDFAAYGGPYLIPNGNNAEELYVKVVSVFEPGTNAYGATASSGYGQLGTIRFDNVRVFTGTLGTEEISAKPIVANTVWYNEAIFNAQGKTAIEVYNITGQKVKSFTGNEIFKVKVNDLSKGVYVVKIITEAKTITQKVIKK